MSFSKNKSLQNFFNKSEVLKYIALASIVAFFYIDFKGVFINEINSDLVNRFSDFRQYAYHYYIDGAITTNDVFSDILIANPGFLPRFLAFLAKVFNNFNAPFYLILISIIVVNIISVPYLIYSFTKKRNIFLLSICLMPFFTLPMAGDGPLAYGYSMMPIAGNTGISLLVLLVASIISKEKTITKIFIGLSLFFIHPLILALSFPLIILLNIFLKSDTHINKNKKSKLYFLGLTGFIWPILLSLLLTLYKNPEKDYSKIVEWISQHNFFVGYPFYIVIFGFLSILYSLKLVADYVELFSTKKSFIGYVFLSYGIGVFLFNIIFVETHLINISSIIMPMRFESILIIIFISILISILTKNNLPLTLNKKFILSFFLSLSFLFSSNIYGQRGILLYLSPLILITCLYFKNQNFKSKKKEFLFFLLAFIIFCIFFPSSKIQSEEIQSIGIIKEYMISLYTKLDKLFVMYGIISFTFFTGYTLNTKQIKKFLVENSSIPLFKKLILSVPIIFLPFLSFLPSFYKYINAKISVRTELSKDEENLIQFINNNLKNSDSILQHPDLPNFRRRLPQYISIDSDLISLIPYLPNKISKSVCALESEYRVNLDQIIENGSKVWWQGKNSYISQQNWSNIKNYHIQNKNIKSLSDYCIKKDFTYKTFNFILEPISEKISLKENIIYSNNKYRLTKININDDSLNEYSN